MNRFISLGILMGGLSGCSVQKDIVLSPVFDVCAAGIQEGYSYGLMESNVPQDRDDGTLSDGEMTADVYVGHHPNLTAKSILSAGSKEGFSFAGVDRGATEVGVVFARKTEIPNDALYVVFSTSKKFESKLLEMTQDVALKTCDAEVD